MKVYDPATWTAPPTASSASRSARTTCPTICSPSRSRRTTAPAAASASTSARPARRSRPTTRPSTWCRSPTSATTSGRPYDFFSSIPYLDRDALGARHGQGQPGARAAVRVLRRLRRLRRDALPAAAHASCSATAWSWPTPPAARRSTAATCPRRRGRTNAEGRGPAWANSLFEDNAEFGLGLRLGIDDPRDRGAPPPRRARRSGGCRPRPLDPRRRAADRHRHPRPARTGPPPARRAATMRSTGASAASTNSPTSWSAPAPGSSAATAGPTTSATRASTTCWRPGATSTCSCSTPRCTRTPADRHPRPPPRGAVAKFAAAGKPTAKKDLGAIGAPTATSSWPRWRSAPTNSRPSEALLEADAWPGPEPGDRLQHLHRPRHRHVEVDEPHEGRGPERLLAALPVPPRRGRGGPPSVRARQPGTEDPAAAVRRQGGAVRDPAPRRSRTGRACSPSWPRPTSTSAGATTSSWPASSAASGPAGATAMPDDRGRRGRDRQPARGRGRKGA